MSTPNHPGQEPPYQPELPHAPYPPQPAYQPGVASYQPAPPPPGYPAAAPQPGYPVAVPPPRKRRRWLVPSLIGGGIVVALCCGGTIIAATSGDLEETTSSAAAPAAATGSDAPAAPKAAEPAKTEAPKPPPEEPKKYKVGETVRGGDFEFVVHGVKCGIAQVGSSYLNRKAQGTFCRTDVSVKNVTKKAHLFHADGTVSAQDASNREYEADGEANIYGNKDGAGFLDEINPGNSIRAFVYFDVPKNTKLTTITFDAGLFTLAEDAVVTL
ncbi:DUF4352 domain-containing protein [Micromonospora sp. NBC_01796]|uniref:DUF4352 domain-containing protein n=1 Tax=Micromonospora sp. NBC_01796 TaxID=2975987 RepID=UPI002DD9E315|nr:DUF4352 domain-containing protein [Micromonospora sp. NBC_01796]WSA83090.1 DUF4352 domain-containing protein [Micromonospora sp. NBC_01796]